ncbi:MAG: hypothetical protein JW920_07705 [Deltaproteobacteria bacterium]|nr:hypothetical protein [Deltaproteobacteria bacterium]
MSQDGKLAEEIILNWKADAAVRSEFGNLAAYEEHKRSEAQAMKIWKQDANIRTSYKGDVDAFILDERVNALWQNADTRKEFNGDRDSFKSYLKAKDQGRVGIYESKEDK